FLEHVRANPVCNDAGEEIRCLTPRDHHKAFSVYFNDPWGHRLEVTTYEAEWVRGRVQEP
ncbi:MAG TPA: hypothetical protein VFC23_11780, partial [Thermoanaerobaculia bacterium]|nr:hypothetical protein [Thermoanaerobaculia bacterium]